MKFSHPDAVVIGGGPAGAACALWLHQLGASTLLIEASDRCGGLQRQNPYRSRWTPGVLGLTGQQMSDRFHEQLSESQVPLVTDTRVARVEREGLGFSLALAHSDERISTSYVVLATGVRPRSSGYHATPIIVIGPGKPVEDCDVFEKKIAILGGGDNAIDAYVSAKERGAASCTMFARSLRTQKRMLAQVPTVDLRLGPFETDEAAMQVNGEPFDAWFVLFGFEPVVPDGLSDLQRHPSGFVSADISGVTNIDGLYAIGDLTQTMHACVTTSAAHGICAAKHIQNRLGL
jgi:thioredoxin reductase